MVLGGVALLAAPLVNAALVPPLLIYAFVLALAIGLWRLVLCAAFGALTAVATYGCARELWGAGTARAAGVVAALFPSLLAWSLLNLKDPLVVLLIALSTYGGLRFARRGDWRAALLALVALALL